MVHIETKAYGKVNIGLKVGGKREDGYHDIDSYFLLIPFFDELSFSLEDGKYSVDIEGNQGYLAEGKTDIMEKAAGIYSEATGLEFSLSIGIKKHIPDKAGLGGGSSDAASVLLFLNGLFKALDEKSLLELSSKVGADVPFFVSKAQLATVRCIGDIIQPMD